MPITYPKFFDGLLQQQRGLRAGIDAMVATFDDWLISSRLPFFTDYTDHGFDHLNCVLATAESLITKSARPFFTAGDAAVLIAATLLHDTAMHISQAGFYQLIHGEASGWSTPGFSDQPWPTLWDNFLFSAQHWDERRLRDVLGETPTGAPRAAVRDPFVDFENLTDTDTKLIGEFIRKYHPRMAHEFACYGIPGQIILNLSNTLDFDLRDLSGLVARSHGLPVRTCLEYLREHHHRREYKGVHAVYLMTLLRISDYLQIQPGRAPGIVFKYRHIPSKLSELEWKAHNAITNITLTHDDPESIEVQANPMDVRTFVRIKAWLSGIQEELDASWAVLGEAYGSQPKLSRLGLILRRVRSNLDDLETFSKRIQYVPERIEMAVARPDLLKLLVGPLYDNEPTVGVRELIQNAVDAVRERSILQDKNSDLHDVPLIDQDHDVEIWLGSQDDYGNAWLTVSDRGVGMSVETIRDYFLTAGASFRNSDAWLRDFYRDNIVKNTPHSRVLRSGRFGIGVLAGFLLGPQLDISTRHIRGTTGIRFSVTLALDPIELKYDSSLRVGTTIRVLIGQSVYKRLVEGGERTSYPDRWSWYIYDSPTVVRYIGDERRELNSKYSVPPPRPTIPSDLRRVRSKESYSVYWTYRDLPYLNVNGIFVTQSSRRSRFVDRDSSLKDDCFDVRIDHPKLCVDDPDGAFPLNLRRSDITEQRYPFESALFTDIVDDFLAYLLVHCPFEISAKPWHAIGTHQGVDVDTTFITGEYSALAIKQPIMAGSNGFSLFSGGVLSAINNQSLCFIVPEVHEQRSRRGMWLEATQTTHYDSIVFSARSNAMFAHVSPNVLSNWGFAELDLAYLTALEAAKLLLAGPNVGTARRREAIKRRSLDAVVPKNRTVDGIRLIVPRRIETKIAKPSLWIKEITRPSKVQASYSPPHKSALDELRRVLPNLCAGWKNETTISDYTVLATPRCPKTQLDLGYLRESRAGSGCVLEVCLSQVAGHSDWDPSGPITTRWKEIIQDPIIPFEQNARRKKLRHAYEALESFIRSHEAMKGDGVLF